MTVSETIGERVYRAMLDRRVGFGELDRALGFSPGYTSGLVHRKGQKPRTPRSDTLHRIALILDTAYEWLLTGAGGQDPPRRLTILPGEENLATVFISALRFARENGLSEAAIDEYKRLHWDNPFEGAASEDVYFAIRSLAKAHAVPALAKEAPSDGSSIDALSPSPEIVPAARRRQIEADAERLNKGRKRSPRKPSPRAPVAANVPSEKKPVAREQHK